MTTAEIELTTPSAATSDARTTMKALVYHGPGKRAWESRRSPTIQEANDAIVRITTSTICGTDLHILKGDLPSVTDGRILGHEGIGVIEKVGSGVSEFHVGDKVIISCVTACLKCDFCRKGMYSHCRHGGWILGNTLDGTQAESVRIPHADGSLHHFPTNGDEEGLVMLSDILPTGFECGVLNGQVKPGDTVAIVGAGPVGLAVLLTAQFYSPAAIFMIDLDDKRLAVARDFGATALINSSAGTAARQVMERTGGRRCRRGDRGGRSAGHLRHLPGHRRRRRTDRQRRRARQARGTAPREALGPQHHSDDSAGGHGDDTHALEDRAVGQTAAGEARDPPLHLERRHEGLRHLWKRRRGGGAQGGLEERRGTGGRPCFVGLELTGRARYRVATAPLSQEVAPAAPTKKAPKRLPKTGSALPLMGLAAVVTLGRATAMRFV